MKTKICIQLLVAATATLFYSCGGNLEEMKKMAEEKAMEIADQEARKEGFVKVYHMFDTGNSDGIENYVKEDVIEHSMMPGITATGIEGLRQGIEMNHTAFPDSKMSILTVAHEGDLTYVHYNWTGTHTGPMGDMPATGKYVNINGVDIIRFEDGKAAEHWGYMEEGKMMEQLGMGPGMEENEDVETADGM